MTYDHLNHIALAVMYIGLFGWLGSTAMFIFRGFRSTGEPRFSKALGWFVLMFVMIGIWIAGLVFLGYEA